MAVGSTLCEVLEPGRYISSRTAPCGVLASVEDAKLAPTSLSRIAWSIWCSRVVFAEIKKDGLCPCASRLNFNLDAQASQNEKGLGSMLSCVEALVTVRLFPVSFLTLTIYRYSAERLISIFFSIKSSRTRFQTLRFSYGVSSRTSLSSGIWRFCGSAQYRLTSVVGLVF